MTIKVLIADDSAYLRKKLSELLSSNSSISVIDTAKNGEEALDLTLEHLPDVLVLDLMMPKMDGMEAFKRIIEQYPVPTIILSSIDPDNLDSSIQALLIGAFDYSIKPGTFGEVKLQHFQDTLIQKIKSAANSQFKKVYDKKEDHFTKRSFRQKRVDEIFKFGKHLQKVASSYTNKSSEKTKKIQSLNEIKTGNKLSDLDSLMVQKEEKEQKKRKRLQLKVTKEKEQKTKKEKIISEKRLVKSKEDVRSREIVKPEIKKPEIKDKTSLRDKKIERSESKEAMLGKKLRKQKNMPHSQTIEPRQKDILLSSEKTKKSIKAIELLSPQEHSIDSINLQSNIIVIGASVGGPKTIKNILKKLPKDYPFPIVIVQHLNSNFIKPFAQSLNGICSLQVKVAEANEVVEPGIVYIAPGEKHIKMSMRNQHPCIKLIDGLPVNSCIPSIDVLFISSVQVYGKGVIGILLTGMGKDGVNGLEYIYNHDGLTITESKQTAMLYGMPKLAVKRKVVNKVLPNNRIPDFLLSLT